MKISQTISDLKYKKVNILDSGIFLHGLICNLSECNCTYTEYNYIYTCSCLYV